MNLNNLECIYPCLGGMIPGGHVDSLQPAYLSIENWQTCLGFQESAAGAHNVWCMPGNMPRGCDQRTYDELRRVFTGSNCAGIVLRLYFYIM